MAIAPPQDDILIRVQQRLAQRGITGAEAASIVAKIEAKLGRVSGSGAGMQRAVGQPSIPTPRGEPVDPRYAKFQVDPNDRLVARGLKPRQIAATPEEIAAGGMRFAAPTTQPVEKRGMFSSGARAFYGGLEDAGDFGITADMLAADNRVTFEVGNRFAQIQAQKRSRPMSEGAAAYAQASQGGAMSLLSFAADRPGAFLQGAIDQNLQSLGSTAASIVGAPLAGALAPALMGSGSGLAEASNELAAALEAEGVDVTDGGAVTRAMNTPDIRARVRDRVLTKSTVVGGADFATMGISSRIPGGKTFVGKILGQAAQTGVEAVGGMAGEALSQVASGQELQTGDILSEGIGELLPGSAQVAALGARRLLNPTTPPPSSPASPTPGGPAPGGVGGNARPPSPPSTPPVDPMDAVADSLDERFKMKPSVLNPLATPPAVNPGAASPVEPQTGAGGTRPGSREEVQHRVDQKIASGMDRQAAFNAVQQELTAEAEDRLSVDGEILVDEYGDEWQVEHFRTEKGGPKNKRGLAKLTNDNGEPVPPNERSTILGDDAIVFARSLRRRSEVGGSPSTATGMVPGEGDDFAVKGRRTQREAPTIPDEGDSFAIKGRKPANEYEGVAFKGRPRVSPQPAPTQQADEYDAAIENIKRQREAKRRAKAPAAEIQALDGAAQNLITQKDLVSRGWILDRRFGLMDPGQQESMILAGERLDPVWGTPQNLREADPADLERLGIARPKPKPFTPPAPPQGRAETLAELLGMDSEEDARRYANSLSPLERERLGLPRRASEATQQAPTPTSPVPPAAQAERTSPPTNAAASSASQPDPAALAAASQASQEKPQAGQSPSPQSTREPWEMTRGEVWAQSPGKGNRAEREAQGWVYSTEDTGYNGNSPAFYATSPSGVVYVWERGMSHGGSDPWKPLNHRELVEAAHAAGKPVPPEVLAEYGLTPNPPAKPDSSPQPQGTTAKDTPKYGIYPQAVKGRGTMFAVRESDNPNGYGDTIHATREEAEKYAKDIEDRDRRNAESRERDRVAQEAKDREEAKRKSAREDTRGFADSMPPMQRGKAIASLNALVRVDGEADTIKSHVEKMVAAGRVELATREEPKIKPMSRTEYNRASQREQEAHEKRMREAGTKTVYTVNGYDLGKTAYDYAKFLQANPQPQGQAAATTNKEPSNGQEEGRQEGLLTEERARLLDAIVKQEITDREARGRFNIEEQIQLKGTDGNWYYANGFPQGVRSTGERRVRGYAVGSQSFQTREQAEKYVADRKAGDDIRADLADSSIEELRKIAGTAAPAESSDPRGTGAASASGPASVAFRSMPPKAVRDSLKAAGFSFDKTARVWAGPDTPEAHAVAKRISDERDAYLASKGTKPAETPAEAKAETPAAPAPAAPDKRTEQVKKLRAVAASKAAAAQAKMDQDRNTNTARRARMADGAISDARRELHKAEQLRKVADAIEAGNTNLARIRTWSDLEELRSLIWSAKRDAYYAIPKDQRTEDPGTSTDDGPIARMDIEKAIGRIRFALPTVHSTWINELRRKAEGVRGLKAVAAKLPRFYDGDEPVQLNGSLIDTLRTILAKVEDRNVSEGLKRFGRLAAMSGETDTIHQGKLADLIRDFVAVTGQVKKAAEDPIKKAERELIGQTVGIDFFPTPKPVADDIISRAGIEPGMKVLEPSAGNGRLADAAKEAGAEVDAVELSSSLRDILALKGHNLVGQDFDEFNPGPVYDRIVMNPPFSDRRDVEHVRRAFDMLKPGGRLVAIMSEGPFFGSDKKATGFRDWLESMGGTSEKLPPNTFMQDKSGLPTTGVNARIVVVDKATTIPQENADGTDRGTTGGVGAARGDGQGPGQGQQGTNAQATRGNAAPAGGVREEPPAAQAQVGGASDSQIRAAKAAAKQTAKAERRKQGARKAADTKAFNARNPQRFSRADVAARIIEKAQQIPDSEQQYGVLGDAEDPNAPGDYVSFAFPRKIPTEVLHAIDAEPQLRTLLSVNPRGLGPDWLGYLGVDKYVAQLRSMFYEGDGASTYGLTTAVRRLEGWADNRQDPEAVFLLWLHDAVNNTEYQRPDWENVATSEFKDGDRFTIAGVPFEVMQDENGYTAVTQRGEDFGPIDNAATFIHEAMEDMPIDKDSRSTADVGEVPDFAPPESPAPAAATPATREPWEMTREEHLEEWKKGGWPSTKAQQTQVVNEARFYHEREVAKARAAGKPVPLKVLAEYGMAAPTAPPKFSDSEGVFGQKTESITGTQRGMFGDISPEPTPDMQERYPGIRRGETVAEYEKRMGTTDTPDMFAGAEDRGDINKAKRGRPKHAIQFKTPIVGPSGAKILAYEWTWTWETVDTKDDTVERRVSDWERAELNDDTNRLIVHQFSVQQPNGDVRTVSLESALQMLGYMDKATGAPIRSLASTLKTLAFNRMKLEQLRKKYEVFAEATKQAHALPFNPKEITREVTDAEFSHLKREGVKRVAWLYRGDVLRWDYWYPSSGTPIPTVFGPNVDMDATAYSWRDSQLKRFIPSDAEGLTESDRKYPENTRARLSQEIKDIERRNEKLQRKIDAFDGSGGGPSSSGGDPREPQRAPSNMADRAIGALERIAAEAEARMQARAKKRGTRLYSTPIPDPRDMIDAAAWAASKAIVAQIKGARAIGKFVTDQVAARWPDAKFDPAVLRRTARRFMDGAKTPQDVYARWQAARNKDDAARTKTAAGAAVDPKAVKEAAAVGTAQRPDVAARIVAEVRKSFRAGKEAGRVQALAALKPVITKAKQAAIRAEQMRKIEQRGGKDAAAAATQAAKVQAETEAGIRDEAVRLVQSIPGVGRRYLKAVSTATGMRDLQKILHRLRKDLAKSVARDSRRRAQVMAKMFKKLNDDRLALARKALYDIEEAWKAIKSKDTGTIRAEELAQAMRESAEQIKALITEQRDEDKVRVLGKMILMSEHRDDMVERITRQKELPQTEKVGADRTPGAVRLFMRKYANFRTLMQILDGQFDENGIFARAHRAMAARRTLELGKNQEFIDRAEAIVKANGYKSWADFTKRTTGSLGDASVEFVNIELGDRKRIPVGLAMAIYAQDPETKSLMHEGQPFKFHRNDLESFTVDDYKLAELEAALTPAQKTIAVAINRLRSEMQFDRADAVYKDITGNRLVKVIDHYPRKRILDQTGNPDTVDVARVAVGEWAVQSLENSGFTIKRVEDPKTPLLLSDFAETQVRAFQGTEMMIQRAQLVKYLKGTIMHPDVINQINARYGTAMVKRLAGVIAEYSGNSQPESDKLIRRAASKLAQTMTQTNPLTWLRNLSTVFRLPLALVDGSAVATSDVLAAMPKAAASMSKTMSLLLKHSPDLRHRWSHAGAAISLMPTGAAPDADSHFADAGKATIRQLLHAFKGIKTGNFTERAGQAGRAYDATLDAIRLGNTFDGYAAAVAYHVFRTKAPTNLSPAAQDRWAARRAADAFMQTANTNDLLNATEFQTDARRNTMTALLLTFTSDIAKMQNLAYLSGKRGGKSMGVTAGSIVASVAWSTAIRYVAAAVLGDDEEKRDEEAVQSVMDELISLLPGGVNLWAPAFKLYTTGSTYGGSGLLDTPLTSLVRHFEAIVRELKKDDTNTAEAAYRLFRLVADPMGNPVGPLSGMARRAIKNYGE